MSFHSLLGKIRWSWVAFFLGILVLAKQALPPKEDINLFPVNDLAETPVLVNGRIKPMDTVARNGLLILSGKQKLRESQQGIDMRAIHWLVLMLTKPEEADELKVFRIDHKDVLGLIEVKQEGGKKYFAFNEIKPFWLKVEQAAKKPLEKESQLRSAYERAVVKVYNQLILYQRIKESLALDALLSAGLVDQNQEVLQRYAFISQIAYINPILDLSKDEIISDQSWVSLGERLIHLDEGDVGSELVYWQKMVLNYREDRFEEAQAAASDYNDWAREYAPSFVTKARAEFLFNHFGPFTNSIALYIVGFLFICWSWVGKEYGVRKGNVALGLIWLAFIVHTIGLITRIYLQGRPPVTNLYSSAIFVGWGAVLISLILEQLHKRGIGSMVASVVGFLTLLIAHHLAMEGDTLEMMRAVLDSNFWLATHVIVITLGYSATFIAGFMAIVYMVRKFLGKVDVEEAKAFRGMVYGTVCFATLFSLVGTILGGIWADQSWGRFWGWDPKENGALLIVIWNAMILHARWGGLIKVDGQMRMAVGGNIITAFSWFGVNMLGIGLHSYGFMESAFIWLGIFVLSQLALIGLSFFPISRQTLKTV
ncbi:MAG: cytochrome c biogenesis protein CcsA [Verrucomicrobiota bacterium]